MFSSTGAHPSSRASSHSFLDPSGLDFDLPAQSSGVSSHITTIPEAEEEDDADYVHIHSNRTSSHSYSEKHGHFQGYGQQAAPISEDSAWSHSSESYHHHQYDTSPPTHSQAFSSSQQPSQQQQQPMRYQYPRTRSGQFSASGSSTGLPLYASRTQRIRNGQVTPSDQGGKSILRGPSSVGGYDTSSSDTDDEGHFVGGSGLKDRMSKRFSTLRSRRRGAWYRSRELQIVAGICVLSLIVRLWRLGYPTSVVFDEVHFGGFASKYIKGRFFMDVHPPLAKMLIAMVGWAFGLDPSFDFKDIGKDYLEPKVPYVAMRMLGGLMGVAVVPMAFYTVKNSGHSLHASILAAVLVLFENALATQSRYIFLDSPLIFFTAFTALAWTNFHNQRKYPFSDDWFIWLFLTGVGLGLAGSVKWVGLFIIATIGTSTINQLWLLWSDLRVTSRVWLDHFIARAVCLIVVPIAIYMFMFEIHFLLLPVGGDGDGFMSAPFQMTLGHSLQDSPLSVAYGATITIRHLETQGGYLHSHSSNYETGSKQQQITLYPHKDTNNNWIIQKRDGSIPSTLEYVKHGDYIRLLHAPTSKRLHSHDNKPPVTETENHFEVSGYGSEGFEGDSNDEWRLEILDYAGGDKAAGAELHTLRSKFKLVHPNMACDLFSHRVKLPKWGFEQQEVTCLRSAARPKTMWVIESNSYSAYPANAPKVNYEKPGFFGKFLELNKVMWTTNAGLTDSHPYDSRPSSWLWLRRGISFWGKEQRHVYLIGNWFTWYLATFSVALYAAIRVLLVLRDKRGYRDNFRGLRDYYELSGGFFFMAWCFHYFPFFLMGRQLFLHHYLPALYFAILLFCVTFDVGCRFIPNRYRFAALLVVSLTAIYVFRMRSSLVYGSEWTRSQCEASRLYTTWDYDCYHFPNSYADYQTLQNLDPSVGRIVEPIETPADKPHDFMENVFSHAPQPDAGGDDKDKDKQQQGHAASKPSGDDTNHIIEEKVGEDGDDEEVDKKDTPQSDSHLAEIHDL